MITHDTLTTFLAAGEVEQPAEVATAILGRFDLTPKVTLPASASLAGPEVAGFLNRMVEREMSTPWRA